MIHDVRRGKLFVDISTPEELMSQTLQILPTLPITVIANSRRNVYLFDLTAKNYRVIDTGVEGYIEKFCVSHSGTRMMVMGTEDKPSIFDITSGAMLKRLNIQLSGSLTMCN